MAGEPRVAILSAYYAPFQGGTETHARALANYLSRRGFGVLVVTKHADGASPSLERIDDIPVHRVWPPGPRTGLRKWLMLPCAFWRLVTLRAEWDVVYCPGYQGIGIAALAAGWLLGRPVILRSGNIGVLTGTQLNAPLARWGLNPSGALASSLKAALRRIYLSADAFVCNSRQIEEEALANGVARERVHYLPNAVDISAFRPTDDMERQTIRQRVGWPEHALICLYVGRLSVEKGVLDLVEAWHELAQAGRLLVLVGPDMTGHPLDAGPRARHYVAERGLSSSVVFYGESRVADLLRAADVYVQPSHYEAFSNAVIEAMATGLPVVASRVGGMLDCITDGANGLLCEPVSPKDLAARLRTVMERADLRSTLGQAARATIVDRFDQEKIFSQQADLIRETARRAPGSRDASAPA